MSYLDGLLGDKVLVTDGATDVPAVTTLEVEGGSVSQVAPGHAKLTVGAASLGGVGLYASRPSPTDKPDGYTYIVTDLFGTDLIASSGAYLTRKRGAFVTPPAVAASSLTALNPSAGQTVTQKGPFWRYQSTEGNANNLRAWSAGNLTKGSGGEWCITLGISDYILSCNQITFVFGLWISDGTQYVLFRVTSQGTPFAAKIDAIYNATLASTSPAVKAAVILGMLNDMPLFLRVRFDGTNYIVEFSQDGILYQLYSSSTDSTHGLATSFVPTTWGIGTNYQDAPGVGYVHVLDVVHLVQTPTADQ